MNDSRSIAGAAYFETEEQMEHKMKHKEVIKLVKRNEAQEFMKSAADYVKGNTENLIIAVAVVLVVSIGIPLIINGRNAGEMKAQQTLAKANYFLTRPVMDQKDAQMYGMFRTKDERLEKAVMAYNEVINTYRGSKTAPYAYLGVADAYYNNGKYKDAGDYYDAFLEKYPKHALAAEALAGRAYAKYEQGKFQEALADLKEAMGRFKGAYNYSDMRLKSADCLLKLNDFSGAKQEYESLINDTGDSYWAGVAKERLKEIRI
jgi:tetratricopeptide (TPR) repeat protein